MKSGFLQFAPKRAAVEENIETILTALRDVKDALVVTPELAVSGYLFRDGAELHELALDAEDDLLSPLYDLLKANGLHVALGFPERIDEKVYNSALLAGPEGLLTVYRKLHLFNLEKLYFTPGEGPPPVVEAGGARIGLMVCYDWFFPETARYLCRKGAQVIAHPANLVLPWCLDAMPTRSLENRLFTITANRTGVERVDDTRLEFKGGSQVVDPDGKRLLRAEADEEGARLCEIDPTRADDKALTERNPGPAEARLDVLGTG